jgi:small-conductance mechanosensitive channel
MSEDNRIQSISDILEFTRDFVPLLITLAIGALVLWLVAGINQRRRKQKGSTDTLPGQLASLVVGIIVVLACVVVLPISENTRGQILSLLGILLTAVIALSSTTFVANAMAGLLLRIINSFGPGDFIDHAGQFGRVTVRGLFHTEIQTEARDLTTIPNLQLVSQPVTVVHSTGTLVSVDLSLGYDLDHSQIETLLKAAAEDAELEDAFVLVQELGDFSVSYRVAGFLSDIRQILSTKSRLRTCILDRIHGAGLEVLSPTFMYQRPLSQNAQIIPVQNRRKRSKDNGDETPEDLMFDKAQLAADQLAMQDELVTLRNQLKEQESEYKNSKDEDKPLLDINIRTTQFKIARLEERLAMIDKDEVE